MSLLEVHDLVVRFSAGFQVGPASFAMDRGILHMQGPNGGGKTTLMKAMSAALVPTSGRVLVSGQDVHRHAPARRHISFVSANPELPDFLSVTEAYQFAASLRRVPDWNGRSLCAALNLDPSLTLANASAGQRQKAEFICALAGDPAVLLLDETFAHLDQASLARVCDWLRDWSTSRLIIFAHHGESPLEPHSILHVDRQSIVTLPRH
ncbi:MAG TPA: ATP-binding cassette domain-containing protein [Steroidobacteraceae bacterium]|jgi:ABC-type multidrug transport system ATPase subunit